MLGWRGSTGDWIDVHAKRLYGGPGASVGGPIADRGNEQIAAPAVRNRATLGGNIASRTGDVLPALLVMDAELTVYGEGRLLRIPVHKWLEAEASRAPYGLLCRIHLPRLAIEADNGKDISTFNKIGRREAFTPSLVTVAIAGRLRTDGTLCGLRLAAGGGTATAHRLTMAESLLEGRPLEMALLPRVASAIREEYAAATDVFADGAYRREAAANVVTAHLETMQLQRAGKDGGGVYAARQNISWRALASAA